MAYTSQEFEELKVKKDLSHIRHEQVGNTIYLMAVPTWVHEAIVAEVIRQLGNYFEKTRCNVFGSNSGLDLSERIDFLRGFDEFQEYFSNRDAKQLSLLPDLQVICNNREELWTDKGYKGVPSLLVEVFSPSTGERDLILKKAIYEKVGISEYWVILDIRNVLVYMLINGKYSRKSYSLDIDLFLEDIPNKDILEVSSLLYSDLIIKLDKKYFYKG